MAGNGDGRFASVEIGKPLRGKLVAISKRTTKTTGRDNIVLKGQWDGQGERECWLPYPVVYGMKEAGIVSEDDGKFSIEWAGRVEVRKEDRGDKKYTVVEKIDGSEPAAVSAPKSGGSVTDAVRAAAEARETVVRLGETWQFAVSKAHAALVAAGYATPSEAGVIQSAITLFIALDRRNVLARMPGEPVQANVKAPAPARATQEQVQEILVAASKLAELSGAVANETVASLLRTHAPKCEALADMTPVQAESAIREMREALTVAERHGAY